jgi:hypothetical protein
MTGVAGGAVGVLGTVAVGDTVMGCSVGAFPVTGVATGAVGVLETVAVGGTLVGRTVAVGLREAAVKGDGAVVAVEG